MIGTRVAHYEITHHLGSGGMGEVYEASDTKLGRSVALKFLPEAFTSDAERVTRFEREARLLASLNHPHIAVLHGLEEFGGRKFLVMELAFGETLAERIERGPIPLEDALRIAEQIAEALESAHEKGVVHRDLKPANIKVDANNQVKVLDFGLAKAFTEDVTRTNVSQSPTLPIGATRAGMILGTAAYMSPEQAKGMHLDRRTDIFAFGCVLYEMLTGQHAFPGETFGEVLAGVIGSEPAWDLLPANTPSGIRRLLRRCLEKDRSRRLQSASDVRIRIDEARTESDSVSPSAVPAASSRVRDRLLLMISVLLLIGLVSLAFVHFREKPQQQESIRFQISSPGVSAAEFITISPDGRNLAFVANNGGPNQVWVRATGILESRALAGTEGATYPFWSPDSAYLAFFAQGKLKKIALEGGTVQTLCDAASGRGGAWNRDGVIIFSAGPTNPLLRVPAAGGVPVSVTKLPEGDAAAGHRFPAFLPDGNHFFYNAGSNKPEAAGVFLGSLDGAVGTRILPDVTNALYAPPSVSGESGYLLFRRDTTLMAQPFDPSAHRFVGDVFPVVEKVPDSINIGFGSFSVSENSTLVFRSGTVTSNRELVWMDRTGKRVAAIGKPAAFTGVAISRDEKKVATRIIAGSQSDLWMLDVGRNVLSRFTFRAGFNRNLTFSPDGNRVVFAFQPAGTYSFDIFQKPAAGNGEEELLLRPGVNGYPNDWSPDGKWIVYQQTDQKTAVDLMLFPLGGDRKPTVYLRTPFNEGNGRFSPDGKWLAYESNESGITQIYVQAIPISGAKFLISSSGGTEPRWRQDGKELFYVSADQRLTAIPMNLGITVESGTPQPLFPIFPNGLSSEYAPSRDGQRFLVIVPVAGENAAAPVTVVTHWQVGLKK